MLNRQTKKTDSLPMWGNDAGPLEPAVPVVAEPWVAVRLPPPDAAACRPSVRPLPLDGSDIPPPGTANPLASASAPSIGRKLNSIGLSWLALKPDSAAAAAAADDEDVGAASRASGDGAGGGGGDDLCSRGDCEELADGFCWVDAGTWSTGCTAFVV